MHLLDALSSASVIEFHYAEEKWDISAVDFLQIKQLMQNRGSG